MPVTQRESVRPHRLARTQILSLPIVIGTLLGGAECLRAASDDRVASMAAFSDSFFEREMKNMNVPGAVLVVVENGVVVVKKGYGLADVATKRPVEVDTTAFRLASVGKTFTALAVLQLSDAGKLQLDQPVSAYLANLRGLNDDVTPRRLLLHTAGLDEKLIGYQSRTVESYPTLEDHLTRRLPKAHPNPDQIPSYSNYGYALLGYAVERISGVPFHDYVTRRLLVPLGMTRTFYAIPPLGPEMKSLATEYVSSGEISPVSFSNPYPAGGVASTAGDMAMFIQHFLAARGGANSEEISAAVALAMTSRQLTLAPGLEGEGFGLNEQRIAGRTAWLKGGAAPKHSAVLVFLPQHNAGLFIALNRQEPRFWDKFLPAFLSEYYPEDPAASQTSERVDPRQVAGVYEFTRVSQSTIEKILKPFVQVKVIPTGPDTLTLTGAMGDLPKQPLIYKDGAFRTANNYAAFRLRDGHPQYLFANISAEHFAFRRIAWWEHMETHAIAAVVSFLTILSFPLFRWALAAWRRIRKRPGNGALKSYARAGHATAAAGLIFLLLAGTIVVQSKQLIHGPIPALYCLSAAGFLFAGCTIWAVWNFARIVRRTEVRFFARVHLGLVALAGVIVSALLAWYHVLSFRY